MLKLLLMGLALDWTKSSGLSNPWQETGRRLVGRAMERMGRTILAFMAAWALAGHPAGAQAQNEYRFTVGLGTLEA